MYKTLTFLFYNMMMYLMLLILLFLINKKSQHPMIFVSTVVIYTGMTCFFISKWTKNFFPFLLFMVMTGGVMIIFIYMVSLTTKDKFNMKTKINEKILMMTSWVTLTSLLSLAPMKNSLQNMEENLPLMNNFKLSTMTINSLYINNYKMTLVCIMLILLILISVIKMCTKQNGPLRQIK